MLHRATADRDPGRLAEPEEPWVESGEWLWFAFEALERSCSSATASSRNEEPGRRTPPDGGNGFFRVLLRHRSAVAVPRLTLPGRWPTLRPVPRPELKRLPLALVVLCLAVLATSSVRAQEGVKLALLPVVVHSSEDPQYLRDGLADMLGARLDQAGVFRVLRVEESDSSTTRLRDAIEAGRAAGADFVLFGSFTRFGQGASLDMQCASLARGDDREPLREIFVHSGSIGDVIPDLDDLVGKVARFAVPDYETRAVSAGPPATRPAASGAASSRALEQRLEALEETVADLSSRLAGAEPQ